MNYILTCLAESHTMNPKTFCFRIPRLQSWGVRQIEMGFFGFSPWLYYKFIQFNNFCWKRGNRKAYMMAVLSTMYLGLCYSTDNVSKYFLVSIPFWIYPLAYAIGCSPHGVLPDVQIPLWSPDGRS